MQLNNTLTNEIVKVTKWDPNTNRIKYSVSSPNGVELFSNVYSPTPPLGDWWDVSTNYEDVCYSELLSNVFNGDHTKTADGQNWIHSIRTKRLIVPQDLIVSSLQEGDALGVIIERLKDENIVAIEKFIFTNSKYAIVYVLEVLPADAAVIGPYIASGTIVVQDKV